MCRYWLYDFDAETDETAKAEKIRTERHGDTEYTYTDHFHVYRDVEGTVLKKCRQMLRKKWTMTRWIS